MRRDLTMLAGLLALAAGCVSTRPFVYRPAAPAAGVLPVPVKVAVLPFADGTEDFEKRGSSFKAETLVFNQAKTGIPLVMTAVTPPLWSKALAQEWAASGRFASVRFVYAPAEALDEGLLVEGTVRRAYTGTTRIPGQYAFELRASRRSDGATVWRGQVAREVETDVRIYDGCDNQLSCQVDRSHAFLNRILQEMFAEAGEGLARALGAGPGRTTEDRTGAPTPSDDSVEKTIERIMEGR